MLLDCGTALPRLPLAFIGLLIGPFKGSCKRRDHSYHFQKKKINKMKAIVQRQRTFAVSAVTTITFIASTHEGPRSIATSCIVVTWAAKAFVHIQRETAEQQQIHGKTNKIMKSDSVYMFLLKEFLFVNKKVDFRLADIVMFLAFYVLIYIHVTHFSGTVGEMDH